MGQYWTRKNDQEDVDKNTFAPWTELLMKEDRDVVRKHIDVAAAIIIHDNKVLSTQRGYGEWKDWWEFPGGKIETGESPDEALRREIREEMDTDIEVGDLLTTVQYDYPKFHMTMHCFACKLLSDDIKLLEHEDARWLSREELDSVKWLPADKDVIDLLRKML